MKIKVNVDAISAVEDPTSKRKAFRCGGTKVENPNVWVEFDTDTVDAIRNSIVRDGRPFELEVDDSEIVSARLIAGVRDLVGARHS